MVTAALCTAQTETTQIPINYRMDKRLHGHSVEYYAAMKKHTPL